MGKGDVMTCDDKRVIGFQMKSVNNMIRRKLDVQFSKNGLDEISGMQGPMIGYIFDNSKERDIFQRDLEREFNVRRSTATVMLQSLEEKGFVIRKPVDYDARLKKIILTEKAIRHQLEIRKLLDSFNEALEQGITREEKEEFFRILDKIKKNLE